MKALVQKSFGLALCVVVVGCGASESRVWRGPRLRSGQYAADPMYAPPVEPLPPPRRAEPIQEPMPEFAPPVRPQDLQPPPTPTVLLEQELPPPPSEDEESVQFIIPVPPSSSMPNALYPDDTSKPLLEQSSAERPVDGPIEVLGEGKIAFNMRGHSTYVASQTNHIGVRPPRVEPELASTSLMQVQYLPLLAPVPTR